MITSSSNSQVKNIIQLNNKGKARKEQGLFVVEGIKMFREAPKAWIEKVYIRESLYEQDGWKEQLNSRAYVEESRGCSSNSHVSAGGNMTEIPHEIVSDSVFRQMSDTQTPQGILTVLRQPHYEWEQLLEKKNPLLIVLEDLQDPGNLGTIMRTGEGAGVDGVLLSKGCVDLFNPKTIRSTMGSIYRMPFLYVEKMETLMKQLKAAGVCTFAAHLNGKHSYDQEDYTGGSAFLIGNEGNGLSDELSGQAECLIRIPMEGQVESLNAAMACGILTYEAARQRRNAIDKNS